MQKKDEEGAELELLVGDVFRLGMKSRINGRNQPDSIQKNGHRGRIRSAGMEVRKLHAAWATPALIPSGRDGIFRGLTARGIWAAYDAGMPDARVEPVLTQREDSDAVNRLHREPHSKEENKKMQINLHNSKKSSTFVPEKK